MPSFSNVCGTSADVNKIITTGGINQKAATGALEGVVFTFDDFRFADNGAAENIANWNSGVAAGSLFYIGKGKFANEGDEATFFEDSDYGVRVIQDKGTKAVTFTQVICSPVHAKLLELNGKSGRILFQTKNGIILGRKESDGKVAGFQATIQFEYRTLPTSDEPIAITTIAITFSDPDNDERNPFEITSDFEFSEIDQIYPLEATVTNWVSGGGTTTFDLTILKGATETAWPTADALLLADFECEDQAGNAITPATVTESTGVYSFTFNADYTSVVVRTAAIETETSSGLLYYLNDVVASA